MEYSAPSTYAAVRRAKHSPSLTREDWIKAALDGLYAEGESAIRVEQLAKRLNVTKGSFYWHFKDAGALKKAALASWKTAQIKLVDALRAADHEAPEDRIRALIDFTVSKDSRHDVGVRAWAFTSDTARAAVAEVDLMRLSYIEDAFSLCGFDEDKAAQRARILYYYQIGEYSAAEKDPEETRQRHARIRADWLTGDG